MVKRKKTPRSYGDLTLDDLRRDQSNHRHRSPAFSPGRAA